MTVPVYAIKIRRFGEKRWSFLAGGGRTNHLTVHALRFYEREAAQLIVDKSAPMNPATEWKVVTL